MAGFNIVNTINNIIIFGHSGQLGQDILEVLQLELANMNLILPTRIDISSHEAIDKLFENISENDIAINCIAMTNTGLCEERVEEAYSINAFFALDIARQCAKNKVKLFQISTDYVFDGLNYDEYMENELPRPLSIYGASKLAGEDLVRGYCSSHFIFRVSSLYGINSQNGNFVETMIQKSKNEKELSVVADQFMSPTHTFDIAKVVSCFISKNVVDYGTYHVSGEGRCSWYEFSMEIFKTFKIDVNVKKISYTDFPAKLERPVCAVLSNKKINRFFKMPKWQDSLREYKSRLEDKK